MQQRIAALALIPFIANGCASLHPASGASSVSLNVLSGAIAGPMASPRGDSDMAPGRAAKAALPPADACQDIMVIFCAVATTLAVPIAAAVGATMKTSQQLPLEQVVELNRVTADVVSQLDLRGSFITELGAEGQRRGIVLNAADPDAEVYVRPQLLQWDISPGNRIAMRLEIEVTVRRDGDRDTHSVTYRTGSEQVDHWVADGGQPIRLSLDEVMAGVSQDIWDRILGREGRP